MRALIRLAVPALVVAVPAVAPAQATAITRADAIDAAVARGARLALAAADTAVAGALGRAAREFPNPAITALHTESTPRYHLSLDIPVDYPWARSARIGAADAVRHATQFRFAFERAAAALDADTLYTLTQAWRARADLSRRNAIDADSLRIIAVARRDAGDASELDVQLATLFAGDLHNVAASDSLALLATTLALQTAMGMAADSVRVTLADSLVPPPGASGGPPAGTPLAVAAATADLDAAERVLSLERRNRFAPPGISVGYETRDPSAGGTGNRILPQVGLTLPIPLFNRNGGAIGIAAGQRDRARAALTLARADAASGIARALRQRDIAIARATRGAVLVGSATRVAAMSRAAYREGAAPLASVLEAQRAARGVLASYVDDLARAWIAIATTRVLTLTAMPDSP